MQPGQPADASLDDQHNTIECTKFRRPVDPRVRWIRSSVEGDVVAEFISRTNVAGDRLNAACIGPLVHHEQNIHFEASCPCGALAGILYRSRIAISSSKR